MANRGMSKFVVAIDGPAGSGKSSVSKQVARQLGFAYLDTGAAYRALAWAVANLEDFSINQLELEASDFASFDAKFAYAISTNPDTSWVRVGDQDVTEAIRSTQVAESVSEVARIPSVRNFMKYLTHELANRATAPGIVIEGRDITTVVYPEAQIRLLLTASEAVRLKRRGKEIGSIDESDVVRQVSERDASDAKVADFITPGVGAALVDSTNLDFEQSVSAVIALIEQKQH
jgi:cytidylate kinase